MLWGMARIRRCVTIDGLGYVTIGGGLVSLAWLGNLFDLEVLPSALLPIMAFFVCWTGFAVLFRSQSPIVMVGGGLLAAIAVVMSVVGLLSVASPTGPPPSHWLDRAIAERLWVMLLVAWLLSRLWRAGLMVMLIHVFLAVFALPRQEEDTADSPKAWRPDFVLFVLLLLGLEVFNPDVMRLALAAFTVLLVLIHVIVLSQDEATVHAQAQAWQGTDRPQETTGPTPGD